MLIYKMRFVLPSNASLDHHPDNSLTTYTVQFSEEIVLPSGQWEVGLLEIQFEKSWHNVKGGQMVVKEKSNPSKSSIVTLEPGYYSSLQDICTYINQNLKFNDIRSIEFNVNKTTERIEITYKSYGIDIQIDNQMQEILGLPDFAKAYMGNFSNHDKDRDAVETVTLPKGKPPYEIKSIYVYSNIAENNRVGDTESPLLRIVPVNNKRHWTTQYVEYQKIQYIPVSQKRFRQISVYLRSDTGEIIPFTNGRTIVTLEFRRVKRMTLI